MHKLFGIFLTTFGMSIPFGIITCKEPLCEMFLCILFISVGLLILIIKYPQKQESERNEKV